MKKLLVSIIFVFSTIYAFGQIDGLIVDQFTPTAAAVAE